MLILIKSKVSSALTIFNLLFVVTQDFWLFSWDYIEISFAIFYGFIILSKKYYHIIPVLTFIHIFNRETALIIILFFIMYFSLEGRKDNLKLIIFMIINFIFGISYTVLSRKYLFIQQNVYLDGGQDLENTFLGGNWIYPVENIKNLINGDFLENLIVITCLFLYFYYLKKNYKIFNFLEKNLVGFSLFMIFPIFIFGNIVESRLYFSNIVIFIYLIYSRKLSKIN